MLWLAAIADAAEYFAIQVVDDATGDPIPCVALELTNQTVFETDVNGVIAFYEPDLTGREVWFTATRRGYAAEPDFFGFEGAALDVAEGGSGQIRMRAVGSPGACTPDDDATQLLAGPVPGPAELFRLTVVDAETGRGVPLAAVRWDGGVAVSDSAGEVALYDPDLVGAEISLDIASHGYAATSAVTDLVGGAELVVQLERTMEAERLYRITGQGRYRDSALLGLPTPVPADELPGLVMGQDTVFAVPYRGRMFWLWGDTNKPSYPLGLFATSGATTGLPPALSGEVPFVPEYFVGADGFSRAMAPLPGDGVTWLGGLATVDDAGEERLIAGYGKYDTGLVELESGVVVFDDGTAEFVRAFTWGPAQRARPNGQAFRWGDHVYWRNGVRAPATLDGVTDPASYEAFTPVTLPDGEIERDGAGRPVYAWRDGPPVITTDLDVGLQGEERPFGVVQDPDTGHRPEEHGGSISWNPYRGRFLQLYTEVGADESYLGEQWLVEGDTPWGPYAYGRKVVTHDAYTLYNPYQHPELAEDAGRVVYFEGTYTDFFAFGLQVEPTPRYDYNQQMFRLDLDRPALVLPVPIYETARGPMAKGGLRPGDDPRVAYFAWDRAPDGGIPIGWDGPECGERALVTDPPGLPLFWVAAPDAVGETLEPSSLVEGGPAVGRVHVNPHAFDLPVLDWLAPTRADGGPDRCVVEPAAGEGATVTLDGGASVGAASATWTEAGTALASELGATVALSVGTHFLVLEVSGPDGSTSRDEVVIEVAAGPVPPGGTTNPTPGEESPEGEGKDGGCGCGTGAAWGGLPLLVMVLLVTRRREP